MRHLPMIALSLSFAACMPAASVTAEQDLLTADASPTWEELQGQTLEMSVNEMFVVEVPEDVELSLVSTRQYRLERRHGRLIVVTLEPGSFALSPNVRVRVRDENAPEKGAVILDAFDGQPLLFSARGVKEFQALGSRVQIQGMSSIGSLEFLPLSAGTHHALLWSKEGRPKHVIAKVSEPGEYPPETEIHTLTLGGPPHKLDMRDVTAVTVHRETVVGARIAGRGLGLIEPKSLGFSTVTFYRKGGKPRTIVYHVKE